MADPRTQAIFDRATHQVAKMLTSPQAAKSIAQDAKARGPAPAIVDMLKTAIQVMTAAAAKAGVQMPPQVAMAAALAVAQLLCSMMVAAGLAKDPDALFKQVQAGLQQQAPAKPGAQPGAAPAGPGAQPQPAPAQPGMMNVGAA